jgi:hypothetical protein
MMKAAKPSHCAASCITLPLAYAGVVLVDRWRERADKIEPFALNRERFDAISTGKLEVYQPSFGAGRALCELQRRALSCEPMCFFHYVALSRAERRQPVRLQLTGLAAGLWLLSSIDCWEVAGRWLPLGAISVAEPDL